jgi:leader peptidase (prepilin peptidase) / N-methyltransferase
MPEGAVAELLAAVFGLLIGSFLNVCIYRWPRDLSVVSPRSRCPACDRQIAWYDNVPVLSFLLLRGRCRACQSAISWRYPVVEALTAAAFVYFTHVHGLTPATAKYSVLSAILIGLAFADLETRILPDELSLGGVLIGIAFALFVPVQGTIFHLASPRLDSLGESLVGAAACSGLLWLAGWVFERIRHKQGLGLGDVKMLALVGAFLGLQGALETMIIGSLLGAVAGLIWIKATGKDAATYKLPFGTFLAAAGLIAAAAGPRIFEWYERNVL